jgi:hypothetical protein
MSTAKKINKLVVRCCVCGKEKSGDSWYYSSEDEDDDAPVEYTHGFCPVCYENELNKVQWRKNFIGAFIQ